MITTTTIPTQVQHDKQRKLALAKVYDLLIKLADETETQPAIPETASETEELLAEQNLVQLALL